MACLCSVKTKHVKHVANALYVKYSVPVPSSGSDAKLCFKGLTQRMLTYFLVVIILSAYFYKSIVYSCNVNENGGMV